MRSAEHHSLPGAELLQLARRSIEHGLVHHKPLPINHDELHATLAEPAATFTTLRIEKELRGCCGTLVAIHSLAEDVARSAFKAAFEDPRFKPVREPELEVISVEVSVLTPLEPMTITDELDLLDQLTPGTDGLVIHAEGRRATFLPIVWKQLPEPRAFVNALKRKCGLAQDYWSEHMEFQRYQTTTYAESAQP